MMPRRMRPAAVLFDNDGLTVDTEPAWTRAEAALFARHGSQFTLEDKRALLGAAPAVAAGKLERMLGRPGHELNDELYELVLAEARNGLAPMAGAAQLIAALGEAGVPLGLVSNSRRGFVELVLRATGLRDAFAVIVTAEAVARPKPAPDAYLAAAAALGVAAADCVVLEDSPTGLAAARAAGARTVGVPSVPGVVLEADVVAASLVDERVWAAVGLRARVP
jgi:HAD superfamily hydrolase (TIGR01509 family)